MHVAGRRVALPPQIKKSWSSIGSDINMTRDSQPYCKCMFVEGLVLCHTLSQEEMVQNRMVAI